MKVYRISWIEKQQILESFRSSKKEAEKLKGNLVREGLHPFVTCDYTENFDDEDLKVTIHNLHVNRIDGA